MVTDNVLTGILHIPVRCLIEDIQECREGKMLSGRDEWEEYRDYDEHFLGRPEYIRELCGRYPELLRLVLRRIEQIVDQLFCVWEAVEGRFSPVKAESVELGISDVHTGGGTAARIRLADGRSFIYKPRSLHKDRIYQGISRWFCKRLGLSFREREIYEMEGCGLDSCIECAPSPGSSDRAVCKTIG